MKRGSRKPQGLPKLTSITLAEYTLDIDHWLLKEYIDIGLAAKELPALIEWLNSQTQVHVEDKGKVQAELARAEARAYFALKNGDLVRKGLADKATDSAIKHAVNLDDEVIRLTDEVAILTGWVERLRNLQKSFTNKMELVRSNEATRRKLVEN